MSTLPAPEQSEYIVQCLRTAGAMYEKDARAFLAEHDGHVRAAALREAADLAEQRTGGPVGRHVLLCFATQLRRAANARETVTAEFFQVDHTYAREHHASTVRFLVRCIDPSPCGTYQVAFGWRIEDGDVTWTPSDSDDFGGWIDVTEGGGSR